MKLATKQTGVAPAFYPGKNLNYFNATITIILLLLNVPTLAWPPVDCRTSWPPMDNIPWAVEPWWWLYICRAGNSGMLCEGDQSCCVAERVYGESIPYLQ